MKVKKSKYNNQKPTFCGQKFDSIRELQRYKELLTLGKKIEGED